MASTTNSENGLTWREQQLLEGAMLGRHLYEVENGHLNNSKFNQARNSFYSRMNNARKRAYNAWSLKHLIGTY